MAISSSRSSTSSNPGSALLPQREENLVTTPVDSLPLPWGLMSRRKSRVLPPVRIGLPPLRSEIRVDTRKDLPAWDSPKIPTLLVLLQLSFILAAYSSCSARPAQQLSYSFSRYRLLRFLSSQFRASRVFSTTADQARSKSAIELYI